MQPLRRSILLLKEAPGGGDSESQEQKSSNRHQQQTQESDQYRSALHSLATDNVETTVDYLAPMATVFPEITALSEAIASGYPNTPFGHRRHQEDYGTTKSNDYIWAFAVTSQNAVHAIEAALTRQPHPDIREAWLDLPIYCLTGATLASVKRVGFKNINCPDPLAAELTSGTTLSLDNGVQLVDFLLSLEWPTSAPSTTAVRSAVESTPGGVTGQVELPINSVPELWFLTGETRMKTLPETLTARQKPFREITVYKTGPRPGFEDEFAQWLSDKSTEFWQGSHEGVTTDRVSDSSSTATTLRKDKSRGTLWLVGFSPRGVDIAVPTLKRFLENDRCVESSLHAATATTATTATTSSTTEAVECGGHQIKWAAIGPTTAKRIAEHLATTLNSLRTDPVPGDSASQLSCGKLDLTLSPVVVVAKAPKPEAVAEAILS
ncbi:MAG: hypothetical protein J3Q66DRAFT_441962 [Benniella sp.]|nr:MAG: hypothetical protein J3Q66DRAFT_441962 [Benniella sp.]